MFSFLSRPKPSLRSQPSLKSYKALSLFVFTLLAFGLLPTAHAQTRPGYWVAAPCDASGKFLSYPFPDRDGFYEMNGTEKWTIEQDYFPDSVIDAFKANPDSSRGYLSVASPLEYLLEPYTSMPIRYGGIGSHSSSGNPLGASAQNFYGQQSPRWWYSASPYGSGSLNGSVTVDVQGVLVSYFKLEWQDGYGDPAPANAVVPDHISLLLKTDIGASAGVSFGSSGMTSGLWATAMATDGLPFGETATAAAGDTAAVSGPSRVLGSHLVRAAVDPSTRIATVYLSGETKWNAVNTIRYGEVVQPYPESPGYLTGGKVTNGLTGASSGGYITARVKKDDREVTLHRDGARGEVTTADGVTHGDSRYTYRQDTGAGFVNIDNVLVFHPEFLGSWHLNPLFISNEPAPPFDINWEWSTPPSLRADPDQHSVMPSDTWDTRKQVADAGKPFLSAGHIWQGDPDAVKHVSITYSAADLIDHATAGASYDLALHDEYDNWRRVDRQGNPLGPNVSPEKGGITLLGTTSGTLVPSGPVSVNVESSSVNWSVAGINGGAVLAGAGTIVSVVSKVPTWVGVLLGLAGLAAQTVASQPSDPPDPLNSPDQMSLAFMQAAYQNTGYNITAQPGQQITDKDNLMDTDFYIYVQRNVTNDQDWADVYDSLRGRITVDTNVYVQMLNYYFYGDQYDNAGLMTTNAPGSVSKPGKLLWFYQWHRGIPPTGPGVNPSSQSNAVNPMPSL